jgi:hypothetical protein
MRRRIVTGIAGTLVIGSLAFGATAAQAWSHHAYFGYASCHSRTATTWSSGHYEVIHEIYSGPNVNYNQWSNGNSVRVREYKSIFSYATDATIDYNDPKGFTNHYCK